MEPILLRRSIGAASRFPYLVSESRDLIVSEGGGSMSGGRRFRVLVSFLGVFQGLPGMLVSRQVILFPLPLGDPMGVRGAVV